MIEITVSLSCDNCGHQFFYTSETKGDIRRESKRQGWKRKLGSPETPSPIGDYADICPMCYQASVEAL